MAFQPDEVITPMAYSFDTFSKASSLGTTVLRADAKAGKLKTRRRGNRHIILVEDGRAYLEALPTDEESDHAA